VIRKVEAPRVFARAAREDGFFAVPVAAGGLDYGDLARVLGPMLGLIDISGYNVVKAAADPFDEAFAATVGRRVLRERLRAIHGLHAASEPLALQVSTRAALPNSPGFALRADLTHHFDGRHARLGAWKRHLLPGFGGIAGEIVRTAPGRSVDVTCFPSLPAALAIGAAFPSIGPVKAGWLWEQVKFGLPTERWSLDGADEDCGLITQVNPGPAAGTTSPYWSLQPTTSCMISRFRARAFRSAPCCTSGRRSHDRTGCSCGRDRPATSHAEPSTPSGPPSRNTRRGGAIHAFLAVPAGVAFMDWPAAEHPGQSADLRARPFPARAIPASGNADAVDLRWGRGMDMNPRNTHRVRCEALGQRSTTDNGCAGLDDRLRQTKAPA
jgi:hypothetical protein